MRGKIIRIHPALRIGEAIDEDGGEHFFVPAQTIVHRKLQMGDIVTFTPSPAPLGKKNRIATITDVESSLRTSSAPVSFEPQRLTVDEVLDDPQRAIRLRGSDRIELQRPEGDARNRLLREFVAQLADQGLGAWPLALLVKSRASRDRVA